MIEKTLNPPDTAPKKQKRWALQVKSRRPFVLQMAKDNGPIAPTAASAQEPSPDEPKSLEEVEEELAGDEHRTREGGDELKRRGGEPPL